jgi:hypothetical protein
MESAKYLVAQYIEDPIRMECCNIGIIVFKGSDVAYKFIGQSEGNGFDNRVIKRFSYPDVYKQWVKYWSTKSRDVAEFSNLAADHGHYRLVYGGEVTETNGDRAKDVCKFLFKYLVSKKPQSETRTDRLVDHIKDEFKFHGLVDPEKVAVPIECNAVLRGAQQHKVSFVHRLPYETAIIEPVDCVSMKPSRFKEHSGLLAYMFDDIKKYISTASPIAIINGNNQTRNRPDVVYGISAMKDRGAVIVEWDIQEQRSMFINQRLARSRIKI